MTKSLIINHLLSCRLSTDVRALSEMVTATPLGGPRPLLGVVHAPGGYGEGHFLTSWMVELPGGSADWPSTSLGILEILILICNLSMYLFS
jgi:hypothetical protein